MVWALQIGMILLVVAAIIAFMAGLLDGDTELWSAVWIVAIYISFLVSPWITLALVVVPVISLLFVIFK